MKILAALLFVLSALVSFSPKAHAQKSGFMFNPQIFYFNYADDNRQNNSKTDKTFQLMHFDLGYIMPSSLYIGGHYQMDSITDKSTSNTTVDNMTGYGPSIGYIGANFSLIFKYYYTAQYDPDGPSIHTSGSGYDLALGYRLDMGSWGVGPEVSFRNIKYTKYNSGTGADQTFDRTWSGVYPSVAFYFFL